MRVGIGDWPDPEFGVTVMAMRIGHPTIAAQAEHDSVSSPLVMRGALLAIVALAVIAGFVSTSHVQTITAINQAGADLTRLMRFLTAVKLMVAAFATAGLVWRLGATVSTIRFIAYAVAAGSMAAGPGLIWGMVHMRLGAFLLHGGLFGLVVLLWRDPATSVQLGRLAGSRMRATRSRRLLTAGNRVPPAG